MAYARTKIRAKKWKERPADTLDRSKGRETMGVIISSLHITINHQFMSRTKTLTSTSLVNSIKSTKVGVISHFLNKNLSNLMVFNQLLSVFDAILIEIGGGNGQIFESLPREQSPVPEMQKLGGCQS